jgi:hypothetical protein
MTVNAMKLLLVAVITTLLFSCNQERKVENKAEIQKDTPKPEQSQIIKHVMTKEEQDRLTQMLFFRNLWKEIKDFRVE